MAPRTTDEGTLGAAERSVRDEQAVRHERTTWSERAEVPCVVGPRRKVPSAVGPEYADESRLVLAMAPGRAPLYSRAHLAQRR